jgi:mono/diheme cytochrome c family protein
MTSSVVRKNMKLPSSRSRWNFAVCLLGTTVLGGLALMITPTQGLQAGSLLDRLRGRSCEACGHGCASGACQPASGDGEMGGTWYWLRSPEEEKRVTMALFNRYCIRCHGPDGRGVWDIPGIPNFTDGVWQDSRSDAQIARIIVEGRGAVMPQFRGTLSLEEAWAIARYLRTFKPGTEIPRPLPTQPAKPAASE